MTSALAEFTDPRLVAIYDSVNAYTDVAQPRFYGELATELDATTIVDLGCGTGLVTRALATPGRHVTGVDPSAAMLEVARRGAGADRVRWIEGSARSLSRSSADLAIMSGHVAQFFVTDESWREALTALRTAVRAGGHLSFESRNPDAREWERWTDQHRQRVLDPVAGPVVTWSEVHEVKGGVVSYAIHYRFEVSGEELEAAAELRFRTREELSDSLGDAGFSVARAYGGWDRGPVGPGAPELILVAA
jgi:SAM-dependent methyltransferase